MGKKNWLRYCDMQACLLVLASMSKQAQLAFVWDWQMILANPRAQESKSGLSLCRGSVHLCRKDVTISTV